MRIRTGILLALTAVLIVLALRPSGSRDSDSGNVPSKAVTEFTCCTRQDVDTVRHPGETFQIHWIPVVRHEPADRPAVTVVLTVSLSRGFSSVQALKAAETTSPPVLARAEPVTVTDTTSKAPVSTITIPRTAPPGFYNVTTTRQYGGSVSDAEARQARRDEVAAPASGARGEQSRTVSGGSIIQVAAG